ncbi:hypothetical protein Ais01nite_83060 [Asanoa ishikariensis]|uniref:DUF3618 domain-containing protein n=1 Tax=Asanoa ishikariensis TaxID=137265 RepID=A0A1H3S9T6_9ACTN|nr:DUF3618 domain-containing protein [Asanoa ishikariensis]GIF70271.1 hypothetical protein Ais01nite_83060 [Asanoa ishikariensis]SDZ34527.1 Protein of unknown function [Asanoa ishikariensis]
MTASGNGSNGSTSSDPAVLRAEIRRTRAELGETVQLLAAKADVKARMKSSASQARDRFRAKASTAATRMSSNGGRPGGQAALRPNPVPVATLIGVAASAVAVILLVMRRRRR